jgi:arylsulfate sulfotransferase
MFCRIALFTSLLMAVPAFGAISVQLAPSPASPQHVGTPIQWTATASDSDSGTLNYQWKVGLNGVAYVVRDFYSSNTLTWDPTENQGTFTITVTVENVSTGDTATASAPFVVTSNVTGGKPVVKATSNPLVALYSAPACTIGGKMRVLFAPSGGATQSTPWKACGLGTSMNFLVAGMRASTTYYMLNQVLASGATNNGTIVSFTTGPLPSSLPFSAETVAIGPDAKTNYLEPFVLKYAVSVAGAPTLPVATDLSGRVVWYYPGMVTADQNGASLYRPLAGGTMLATLNDPTSSVPLNQILRQMDLLGNALQETNVPRVSQQLVAMGQDPITSFSHDAILLPNGHIIALATNERILTNVQGPGPVDVVGNMLVDLDTNLQVVWAWNAFDELDTSRAAVLGETCTNGASGCPPVTLASTANDWLHGNSVFYDNTDGNLIISLRHQDWVLKIDYAKGTGSGSVIWHLGLDGDFTLIPLNASDPYPWFSHQHDAEYDIEGFPLISLFDDGNTRKVQYADADSRGQVFWLNEKTLTATQLLNSDLGSYSQALGSAQLLSNGNFAFDSGIIITSSAISNQSVEVLDNGTVDYVLESPGAAYRTFRMTSMYEK